MSQPAEVFGAYRRAGFRFDRDHPAIGCLDQGSYLDLVLGPVVVQPAPLLRPGQLPGQLHEDEAFRYRPRRTTWIAESGGILADQMTRDSGVDEGQLGRAHRSLCLPR